jgi:hypothetical protein
LTGRSRTDQQGGQWKNSQASDTVHPKSIAATG